MSRLRREKLAKAGIFEDELDEPDTSRGFRIVGDEVEVLDLLAPTGDPYTKVRTPHSEPVSVSGDDAPPMTPRREKPVEPEFRVRGR